MTRREVAFLVPEGIDDPARVSGGNVYDRRVRDGLVACGWAVSTVEVTDAAGASRVLRGQPLGSAVLVDGLVALGAPDEIAAASTRLRIIVLAHMVAGSFPDATARTMSAERQMLDAAGHVIVTSRWTAAELARRGLAGPARVSVAAPGVELPNAGGDTSARRDELCDDDAGELLCVGVIAPHKGQDLLLDALSRLPDRQWRCTLVGSTRPFRGFADTVARGAQRFDGRVRLAGTLDGSELAAQYRRAALLVAPSRIESSGMAIAEARGHAMPVVAAAVGGIPDTVAGGGAVLVPPDDPAALADALDGWLSDPALRRRLRTEARAARSRLSTWADTVTAVAAVLEAP